VKKRSVLILLLLLMSCTNKDDIKGEEGNPSDKTRPTPEKPQIEVESSNRETTMEKYEDRSPLLEELISNGQTSFDEISKTIFKAIKFGKEELHKKYDWFSDAKLEIENAVGDFKKIQINPFITISKWVSINGKNIFIDPQRDANKKRYEALDRIQAYGYFYPREVNEALDEILIHIGLNRDKYQPGLGDKFILEYMYNRNPHTIFMQNPDYDVSILNEIGKIKSIVRAVQDRVIINNWTRRFYQVFKKISESVEKKWPEKYKWTSSGMFFDYKKSLYQLASNGGATYSINFLVFDSPLNELHKADNQKIVYIKPDIIVTNSELVKNNKGGSSLYLEIEIRSIAKKFQNYTRKLWKLGHKGAELSADTYSNLSRWKYQDISVEEMKISQSTGFGDGKDDSLPSPVLCKKSPENHLKNKKFICKTDYEEIYVDNGLVFFNIFINYGFFDRLSKTSSKANFLNIHYDAQMDKLRHEGRISNIDYRPEGLPNLDELK
jgi:hypothetical protein